MTLTLERQRDLLRRGAVLVDERDTGIRPRVVFYLEHSIQDASLTRSGERRVVSKRMLYVELDAAGLMHHLHYAPYLDFWPYVRRPFHRDPDFGVTSVNYDFAELLARAEAPS